MADILQFIPRANPNRDAKAVEIKNVRKIPADEKDTAPAEYVAPVDDEG